MTKVVISYDTEDYINPVGADGILDMASILTEEGVVGCFNVVGWLAKALVSWGRTDVIEALKQHEIETHSLAHTYHPTICEYTDIEDFDAAMALFREKEDEALRMIQEVFGNDGFYASCPPGDSFSYVAHYGYADMGIPINDGDLIYDVVKGRPVTCCNQDCYAYHFSFDAFLYMTKEEIKNKLEEMAAYDVFIAYHHPQMHRITQFADILNFKKENREGEYILSELRPLEVVEDYLDKFRYFIRLLKEDPRFEIVTYREVSELYREERKVKKADIPELKKQITEDFFPVTTPQSLSLSDIMLACRDFLTGKEEHTCGKVYGFLSAPYAISQPVTVTRAEMEESAGQIKDGEFLPTEVYVGDKKLGPADWLRAALILLSGEEQASVVPDKWQIDLNEFPRLRDYTLVGTWMHADTLEDKYLTDRFRLQMWTVRLPKGTKRRIF